MRSLNGTHFNSDRLYILCAGDHEGRANAFYENHISSNALFRLCNGGVAMGSQALCTYEPMGPNEHPFSNDTEEQQQENVVQ